MNVLLSIKPEFAGLIFRGIKKYEYRKALFTDTGVEKIYLYASHPVKKIVGEITIEHILHDSPDSLWRKTGEFSGVSKAFFFDYFGERDKGYAIKIKSSEHYVNPIDPYVMIKSFKAPQSFMYLPDIDQLCAVQ